MAFNPAAAHARRDSLYPLVKKEIEGGAPSLMEACRRAKVHYQTVYRWTREYRDWNELLNLSQQLRKETRGGARG